MIQNNTHTDCSTSTPGDTPTPPDGLRSDIRDALTVSTSDPHSNESTNSDTGGDGEVVNVNVKTSIGRRIAVDKVVGDTGFATQSTRSNHCEISFPDTPGAMRLYPDGTVILTGGLDTDDIITALRTLHHELQALGISTEWNPVTVENVVVEFESVTGTGDRINLDAVALGLDSIHYEPENFPGAIYRTGDDDEETCLFFSSGKAIVQGAESAAEAVERREELISQLSAYDLLD